MLCPKFLAHDFILMSDLNSDTNLEQNEGSHNVFNKKNFFTYKHFEEEWNDLFKNEEVNLEVLKQKAVDGELRHTYFRSIIWRILLGILHKQPLQWLCQLQMYRRHYNEILTELNKNPRDGSIPSDNPLSQDSESIWQKYFYDEELKTVILQDVKRTFPDIDFFRCENIQNIMVRILFCYARQNPVLCYRQGMHEILAPIILVLHNDHQSLYFTKKYNSEINQIIPDILCPEYLEQDAYSIFKNIMGHIQCSYKINNMKGEVTDSENEIIKRLDHIKKNIFQRIDPELCSHLEKLDIPMHLFGIRWLRLLFGREFPLPDLLTLWDFLFSGSLENVNYTVVAMLVAIRQILLSGDYNTCLSILMTYPINVSVSWIMKYVLYLKDPSVHTAPHPILLQTFFYGPMQPCLLKRINNASSKSPKLYLPKPSPQKMKEMGKTDCLEHNFLSSVTNFPEDELEHIKMVLSIVHHKLLQFHALIRTKLQDNTDSDITLIIDGIHELSCILKNYDTCEIETACEAGENKVQDVQAVVNEGEELLIGNLSETSINNEQSQAFPRVRRGLKSGELKVFKHQIGGCIIGAPMIDPLHLIKNSDKFGEG